MDAQLATLLQEIEKEEIGKILSEARREAEARLQRASADAEAVLQAALERAKARAQVERSRVFAELYRDYQDRLLRIEHAIVGEIIRRAEEKVKETYGKRRDTILPNLIEEVLQYRRGNEPVHLAVHPDDEKIARKAVKDPAIKIETDASVEGGVRVFFPERSFLVSNTLKDRLDRARAILLNRFFEILFPEGEASVHLEFSGP